MTTNRYSHLQSEDPELFSLIEEQEEYESSTLKMIPSENFADYSILEANGSSLTNKYAEGYPGRRYYEGNNIVDKIEELARSRAKALFGAEHANVQPYSGAPANQAALRALLQPGEKVMGMPVPEGGHLTHGWKVNFSGIDYKPVHYGVRPETGRFDFEGIRQIALKARPRVIIVGATAYPRIIQYEYFASIAREVDAYVMADIAHINGLIVAGLHPDPVVHSDVVTSTTHKILGGPRAGFILSKTKDEYRPDGPTLAQRIDRAVFPTLQAGPHMNTIAAMAVAFHRAGTKEYQTYARQVVRNCAALADGLLARGYKLVTGGTDNHLLVIDFKATDLTGKGVARSLAQAGIITNFNMVPGDKRPPTISSGVRLGTPAVTTLGMKEPEMERIVELIDRVCKGITNEDELLRVRREVRELCTGFAAPGIG